MYRAASRWLIILVTLIGTMQKVCVRSKDYSNWHYAESMRT